MRAEHADEFRAFVQARSPALLRTAFLLTGDTHAAQDLLQTALTATAGRWPRIRDRGQPETYVRRALYRHAINRWRSRARHPETLVARTADRPGGADPADLVVERSTVLDALRRLPPRQRAVVVLRYYEDRPEADIARLLGVTVGTVRSQTSKALATLRSHRVGAPDPQSTGRTVR